MIEIDADGFVEVGEDAVNALLAHGFMFVPDAEARLDAGRVRKADSQIEGPCVEIDQLRRVELFALLREKGVSVSLPITNEELRVLAKGAIGQRRLDPADDVIVRGS